MAVHTEVKADPRRWLTLGLLGLAQLMLIIDITVVQVALPTIGTDLRLDRDALTWVVTAYTLCFGGLMVFGGRLADLVSPRRTLLAGVTLFTLASLTCGFAVSGGMLIAGRAVQGVGAALMSPAALAIITTTFTGKERTRALGIWAAIGGGGATLGVLVSGLLTAGPGWPWVFYVNLPIGVLVLAALPFVITANKAKGDQRLDVLGALTITAATAALIYGVVRAGDGFNVVPLLVAAALYAVFVLIEGKVRSPLVRLATLRQRPVVSGALLMLISTGLLIALFFLASPYLQHTMHLGALATGLTFLPAAIAVTAGSQLGSHLISRLGGRPVAVAGLAVTAVGLALLTQISAQSNAFLAVIPGITLAAFGLGPVFVVAMTTTLSNVAHQEAGVASGVLSTFHELGGAIGVAVVSSLAVVSFVSNGAETSGFTNAYAVAAVVAVVTAVAAAFLVPAGKPAHAAVGHGH